MPLWSPLCAIATAHIPHESTLCLVLLTSSSFILRTLLSPPYPSSLWAPPPLSILGWRRGQFARSGMSGTCPMGMVFHTQGPTCLLFLGWPLETGGQYVLAALVIFLLALVRESVALFRTFREAARTSAKQVQQLQQQQQHQLERDGAAADAAALALQAPTASIAVATSNRREIRHLSHPLHTLWTPFFPVTNVTRVLLTWQCVDSLLFVGHLALGYLLMLLVMTFQFYLFLLVLCSSFLVHMLVRILYEPWFDGWQRRQQDFLNMLSRGSLGGDENEIMRGEDSHELIGGVRSGAPADDHASEQ